MKWAAFVLQLDETPDGNRQTDSRNLHIIFMFVVNRILTILKLRITVLGNSEQSIKCVVI